MVFPWFPQTKVSERSESCKDASSRENEGVERTGLAACVEREGTRAIVVGAVQSGEV